MHIADGIVPLVVAGPMTALAVAGVARGLMDLKEERLPACAMMAAVVFVASLIHVPVGPSSAHLLLTGLAGILAGWAVFPILLVTLGLQAVFFGFGGLAVLGVNTLNMALPAVGAFLVWRLLSRRLSIPLAAGLASGLAIVGAAGMVALTLALSGEGVQAAAWLVLGSNLPVAVMEAMVTGAVAAFLMKVRPETLVPGDRRAASAEALAAVE